MEGIKFCFLTFPLFDSSSYGSYTADEDFVNADAVFDCIGDPPEVRFDLDFCGKLLLEKQFVS